MNILQIGIIFFVFIEILNVLTLYYAPGSKRGNGLGVFNSFEKLQYDDETSDFLEYLIFWVAGAKLIFIMLGIVIVIFGNYNTQLFAIIAFIISILSFYYKMYPIIKKLDNKGELNPIGYSKTLSYMIASFIVGFTVILVMSLINNPFFLT